MSATGRLHFLECDKASLTASAGIVCQEGHKHERYATPLRRNFYTSKHDIMNLDIICLVLLHACKKKSIDFIQNCEITQQDNLQKNLHK